VRFLSLIDRLILLVAEPAPLSDEDWRLLLTGSIPKTYNKNDIILEEGQFNYYLYRCVVNHIRSLSLSRLFVFELTSIYCNPNANSVKTGKVRIEKGGKVLATLGPATVLGDMSTLGRYETSATVRGRLTLISCFCCCWSGLLNSLLTLTCASYVDQPMRVERFAN
jgi:hypothetical protein